MLSQKLDGIKTFLNYFFKSHFEKHRRSVDVGYWNIMKEYKHEKGLEMSTNNIFCISHRVVEVQNLSTQPHVLVILYICLEIFYPAVFFYCLILLNS